MFGGWEGVLERIKDVPGDLAEFGVFEGENVLAMARTGRHVWAWDTFEGMPDDDYIEVLDRSDPPGKWKPNCDVIRKLAVSGMYITPVVGRFSHTLKAFGQGDQEKGIKFAFVNIDCDNYWAYKRVLEFITPRMSPGGVVRLDDYECCDGAQKATDEWLTETGKKLEGDWIYF